MYLYFADDGTLMSTCSDDKATFTIDGKTYSTATELKNEEYDNSHGYKLKDGKIIDLGVVEKSKGPMED